MGVFFMQFFKTIYKNEIVFLINQEVVDDSLVHEILKNSSKNKKIGLDMSKVQNINSPVLINQLLANKIKLFNPKSEVLAYLSIILKDGFLKSYINYSDFKENKRELIKRRFLVA